MSVLTPDAARKLDQYLDDQHERLSQLGKRLFEVFKFDDKKQQIATQVRNLQQVANSAMRFADIEDFVKNQMGKKGSREWKELGDDVLQALASLRETAKKLDPDPSQQMNIRLRLARGWVRAVVSEYLYCVAKEQMEATP